MFSLVGGWKMPHQIQIVFYVTAALFLVFTGLVVVSDRDIQRDRALVVPVVLAAGLAVTVAAAESKPDLVLVDGKIFTSDAARPYVEALAIRGERIVAAGDSATIKTLAGPQTKQIDLGGRTVIPGINDAHYHIQPLWPREPVLLNVGGADPTWSEVRQAISEAVRTSPKGTLVVARIGPAIFHDPSIARDALDEIGPDHLVILVTLTGHAAILNSAALRSTGIREDQRDPVGGRYERSADGKLTGVLREYAVLRMWRTVGLSTGHAEAVSQIDKLFSQVVKYGITSMQDLSTGIEPGRTVRLLEEAAVPIRVRIIRMPLTTPGGRDTKEGLSLPRHPNPLITVSGTKWMVDGVAVENTFDQALFHVAGYPAAAAMLEAMNATGGSRVWAARRVRFEHGDGLFADLFPAAKDLGVVVVQNPTHRGPIRSFLDAGIPVALGSDGPFNPYLNIMLACQGGPESITREEAMIAYTRTAAYAEFLEKEKGTLEPGKLADVAVLSQDIFNVSLSELPRTESVLTLVGGKIVYDARSMGR